MDTEFKKLEEKLTFRKHLFLILLTIFVVSGIAFVMMIYSDNLKIY